MKKIAVPKLTIDQESMTGGVNMPESWEELDTFTQMDILTGWATQFSTALEYAKHRHYGDEYAEAQLERDEMRFRIEQVQDHPLFGVMLEAIEQAMFGKGGRHGGDKTPFLEQPWVHYAKMHGRGFLTGQAAKKLEEAASTREGDAFKTEVLGAIVYSGMAILKERGEA